MPRRGSSARVEHLQHSVELGLDGLEQLVLEVVRRPRARHVRLHVEEDGTVRASVPRRFSLRRLDPIVRERAEWLREALLRVDLRRRDTEVDLERGDPVRLHGEWHPTRLLREEGRSRPRVRFDDGVLELCVGTGADPHDALCTWYRREARRTFEERTSWWAARHGVDHGRISIREQRTRWGSCSHRGDLSFNWRLVLAPLWVLDSIVVHELCHVEHLDHSDRFWALLDERYPRHVEASEWLAEHGPALRVTAPADPLVRRPAPGAGGEAQHALF